MSAGLAHGLLTMLLPTHLLAPLHLPALAPAFVASLGWTLLHFVWQGTLVGCATAVLLVALRNARPESRYALACGALLLCIAWPVADLVLMLQDGRDIPAARLLPLVPAPDAALQDAAGVFGWLQRHLDTIVGAWAACAAAFGLRMALGLLWIGHGAGADDDTARGDASERRDGERAWQARLSQLAARAGMVRHLRLRIVDSLASPITAGCWRPIVLVPAALVTGMPPALLEALLVHELGHVRRHDYLVNLAQNVIEALLFYHPAVWWISRRIRHEREQIADDFAARLLGEPRRLARALSELERLQFSRHHLAQAAAGGDLASRIRRLLRPDRQALDWRAALPGLSLMLGLVVACAAGAHALSSRSGTDRPAAVAATAVAAAAVDAAAVAAPAVAAADVSRRATMDFTSCRKPQYPKADIAAGHEGAVIVGFRVDAAGAVMESKILQSSGYASMDEAARGALHRCRFKPALSHGRPVPTWTPVKYIWTLA